MKRLLVLFAVLVVASLSFVTTASAASQPCTSDPTGSTTRLYRAYFLRAPDSGGLAFWMDRCNRGVSSLVDISDAFAGSPEFNLRYGALSNTDFVTLVYRNVLDRAPDQSGLDAHVGFLGRGARRGEVMLGFSESAEFIAKTSGTAPTPTPVAAPKPVPAPATAGQVNIGYANVFSDASSVQVFDFDDYVDEYFEPDEGQRFVAIDAQVCAGSKPVNYNFYGFKVGGLDNRRFGPTLQWKEPRLGSGTIGANCIRGYVTFEVPVALPITTIYWDYPGWGSGVSWTCGLRGGTC